MAHGRKATRSTGSWWSRILAAGIVLAMSVVGLGLSGILSGGMDPLASGTGGPPLVQGLASSFADKWPTYLHDIQRTAANHGDTALSPANASGLTVLWQFHTQGPITAEATSAGSVVYVGSWDGYEYALNATTGQVVWTSPFLGTSHGCGVNWGIASTATVAGGKVYVGGGNSTWYALSKKTGQILWSLNLSNYANGSSGVFNWASPLIHDGFAYIGISSLCDQPLVPGGLLMVNLRTHTVVHQFYTTPSGDIGASVWASPTLDPFHHTLYIATGNPYPGEVEPLSESIIALNSTTLALESSWQVPASQAIRDGDFGATPTLIRNHTGALLVVDTNKNGQTYAWSRSDLSAGPVWNYTVSNLASLAPAAWDGAHRLFIGSANTTLCSGGTCKHHFGAIRAFNPNHWNLIWQHGMPGHVEGAPAWSNGIVAVAGGKAFEVLNATSGHLLYRFNCGRPFDAGPTIVGSEIFEGCVNGTLYAFGLPAASVASLSHLGHSASPMTVGSLASTPGSTLGVARWVPVARAGDSDPIPGHRPSRGSVQGPLD